MEGYSYGYPMSTVTAHISGCPNVAPDGKSAVGMIRQRLGIPNHPHTIYYAKGLDANVLYHFTNRSLEYNVKEFGDLVNTVAPVHIEQDSVAHNLIAKFVKMDGETEDRGRKFPFDKVFSGY